MIPHRKVAEVLNRAMGEAAARQRFAPLCEGLRECLSLIDVQADRIQIPFSRDTGFRHPTFGLVLLTWSHDGEYEGSELHTHEQLDNLPQHGVVGTTFEGIFFRGESHLHVPLHETDAGYPFMKQLQERGYKDYFAFGIPMPTGEAQPLSVSSLEPFSDGAIERVLELMPIFGMATYGVYRTSQAQRLARVYVGRDSGPRVLAGDIKRGSTQHENSGILFCDMRGFTALTERLGPDDVVQVVNEVFQIVGEEASSRGGEILKFIGDAMLITFAHDDDDASTARSLFETADNSIRRVDALAAEKGLPLSVGFGGHIGEVVRGNIGTADRLDFTVMGPAVNLTSRLESLCKPLHASAVFSPRVATHLDGLAERPPQTLKGIATPQPVWVLE